MMRRVVEDECPRLEIGQRQGGLGKRVLTQRVVEEEKENERVNNSILQPSPVCKRFCYSLVLLLMLTVSTITSWAQCNCDFVISTNAAEYVFDGQAKGVKPGDVICFASGTRTGITLANITGSPQKPVTITNMCDGKVTINAPSNMGNSLEVVNCKYIHLTGTGNPSVEYGIEVKGATMGVNFHKLSTDIEADHLNVNNVGCVGIVAKTDPTCDPSTWRGNFVMENLYFHHNKLDKTGCEGFYIGNSHYVGGVTKTCDGKSITIMEHDMYNVEIAYNELTNIGNDGIQFSTVLENMIVHHNKVYNFGTNKNDSHMNGIQSGAATHSIVYNNIIDTGNGYGVFEGGRGNSKYFNNQILNCNIGMLISDNPPYIRDGNIITNNLILNAKETGVFLYTTNTDKNLFLNNIIVTDKSNYSYIKFNSSNIKFTDQGNIKTSDLSSVKFVNPSAKDYHLQTSSPAKNGGVDLASYGITGQGFDLDEKPRPSGGKYDIGTYEFQENQQDVVTVNAGSDVTVTLPTNSAVLKGTASSSTGSISTTVWTKVSGGTATLSGANTLNLNVSSLQQGNYTFRLTVTSSTGKTASDDVSISVLAPPPAEILSVNAGSDVTLTLPTNSVALKGTASSSTGNISTTVWTKVSGGTATLSGANTLNLNVSSLQQGNYTFRLTVTSSTGKTASDDVSISVFAPPPAEILSVNAGSDVTLTLPTNSVALKGTASSSTGSISTTKWTKVSGGTATLSGANTLNLNVSSLQQGNYTFRLTVTSSTGKSASDDVKIAINPASITAAKFNFTNSKQNVPGWNDLVGHPHQQVVNAVDPSSGITVSSISTAQWNPVDYGFLTSCYNGGVTDGTIQPAEVVNTNWFCYNAAYGSTINGVVQKDNIMISKLNPSHLYRLSIGASRKNGGAGDQYGYFEYRINGGSPQVMVVTDNGDKQIDYDQITPDASGKIGISARKLNGSSMNFGYVGWLVVEDLGANANKLPNELPIADAGSDVSLELPTNSITIDGQASDPDGSVESVKWSKLSGPSVTMNNPTSTSLSLSNLAVGIYNFRLTVTDDQGDVANDDTQLVVTYAKGAKFNFSNTNDNVTGWTTLYGSPHAQFIEARDGDSNIRVNNVSTKQWNPVDYGFLTTSYNGGVTNGTVQPVEVVKTNWFNYNAPYGSTVGGTLQGDNIQLLDLKPNTLYQIAIGASRKPGGASDQYGVMEYRFNGQNSQPLLVTDNTSTEVVVEITSDDNGRIGISARKVSGNAMNFGYVGWLVVEETAAKPNTSARIAAPEFDTSAEELERVRLRPYPNPASHSFSINLTAYKNESVEISIISTSGTVLRNMVLEGGEIQTIPVDDLVPGMYLIKLFGNRPMVTEKLLIRR